MIITIHRGSHEIGGTCVELESKKGSRIVLDLGQPLPSLEAAIGLPKPEVTRPDVKGLYQSSVFEKPMDGLLISHAHQDHYGMMQNLSSQIPCFISEPTRKLIEVTATFTGNGVEVNNYRPFRSGEKFSLGDFLVTPYLVDHSAFDAHAFLVEDGETRMFYSGDFRAHGRKSKLFDYFVACPPAPVDVLMMEGTMMARVGETCDTEKELERKLVTAVEKEEGLVLSTVSGQNIDRLVTLFRVARRTKRILVIDPYIAHILDLLSAYNPGLPHLAGGFLRHLRVFYPLHLCQRMRNDLAMGHVLDKFEAWRIRPETIRKQPNRYILLTRDSMVSELASGLKEAANEGLLLYGIWKGYWSKPGMSKLKRWVDRAGMKFFYAHTSGHAMISDLQKLVDALKPKAVVPIHTNCPAEYVARFSAPVLAAQDGVPIEI